jgi:hypothetical protein
MPNNEPAILNAIGNIKKSEVKIATIKTLHNIFCQTVPVGNIILDSIIDARRKL